MFFWIMPFCLISDLKIQCSNSEIPCITELNSKAGLNEILSLVNLWLSIICDLGSLHWLAKKKLSLFTLVKSESEIEQGLLKCSWTQYSQSENYNHALN